MAETKSTLPMTTTVPEFVYDETKDPIDQLQTYIFENKLLFDFYLEDIKDTEGRGSPYVKRDYKLHKIHL